ncbi:MAG TPA: OPT/YSL family transporter [Polyangiaceae bacterium]|nr:OPT/YSL family transporter [Polyangiaceae bacterium]
MTAIAPPSTAETSLRWRWLPAPGTWKYHLLLGSLGILVLGPLGGVTSSFMNFSIGFFVGGQVLAGILGSTVTYGYGPEGKHGANFVQTCAASVAGLSSMAVVIQAMVWLGLPEPPAWQLILYFLCIGMFGAGVGMLYTPMLVDRLQLPYPEGLAVANILRALTDKRLLRRSVATLGGGTAAGVLGGIASLTIPAVEAISVSTSTLGAGMIVGARITVPALVAGLMGRMLKPYFVSIGWLHPTAPVRKITFIFALGMIMGGAALDVTLILIDAVRRMKQVQKEAALPEEEWKRTNVGRLVAWVAFWATGVIATGSIVMHADVFFLVVAVLLVFLFTMVNGISLGITSQNPISSAFVVTVLLLGTLGLASAQMGLSTAVIVLASVTCACDMQQDRSTGWRLGSNRTTQFRYQVAGIAMGAVMAVVFAKVFMNAYPVLRLDQTGPDATHVQGWQSAMTFKMVGALSNLTHPKSYTYIALWIGVGLGLGTEAIRKLLRAWPAYKAFVQRDKVGFSVGFLVDAIFLPSPYAFSFGGFVELATSMWFGAGGVVGSLMSTVGKMQRPVAKEADLTGEALPEDMSTVSLIGGGLIAGDSLAALGFGISILLGKLAGG